MGLCKKTQFSEYNHGGAEAFLQQTQNAHQLFLTVVSCITSKISVIAAGLAKDREYVSQHENYEREMIFDAQ